MFKQYDNIYNHEKISDYDWELVENKTNNNPINITKTNIEKNTCDDNNDISDAFDLEELENCDRITKNVIYGLGCWSVLCITIIFNVYNSCIMFNTV